MLFPVEPILPAFIKRSMPVLFVFQLRPAADVRMQHGYASGNIEVELKHVDVVAAPLGVTVPVSLAAFAVIEVADPVTTTGAGAAVVVNV